MLRCDFFLKLQPKLLLNSSMFRAKMRALLRMIQSHVPLPTQRGQMAYTSQVA